MAEIESLSKWQARFNNSLELKRFLLFLLLLSGLNLFGALTSHEGKLQFVAFFFCSVKMSLIVLPSIHNQSKLLRLIGICIDRTGFLPS